MSRLIASDHALRALLFLSQRSDSARISEVADALDISYTGAQKALEILIADHLAVRVSRRFAYPDSRIAYEAVRFALAFLAEDMSIAALARGNEAVEFAGQDERGFVLVFRRFSDPVAEAKLCKVIDHLADVRRDAVIEILRKEDIRRELSGETTSRRRALGMRVLAGSVDRTFPDRTRHGAGDARPLARLNSSIAPPSDRRLRAIAREFGLRRITAFGSATRSDFRPDSDIDLLAEVAPGRSLGLDARVALIAEAEELFGRDVDVLTARPHKGVLAREIDRDAVVLYDATR